MKAERGGRRLPLRRAVELEHEGLAVAVVEAGAHARALRRAGDARLAGDRVLAAPHGRGQRPAHQPDLAAEQRGLDLLPDAGRLGAIEAGEHAAERQDRAGLVGDRDDPGLERQAGHRIGLGDAAERLRHGIGAGQARMRAFRPVAGDRDVDDLRVDPFQVLVAEAVLLGRAGAEVLSEDVGALDEAVEDLAPFRGFQIEGEALHAAVVGLEIGAGEAGNAARLARVVADLRNLDLDDLRAQIRHQHIGDRARLRRGAGNDLDAVERSARSRHLLSLPTGLRRQPPAAAARCRARPSPPRPAPRRDRGGAPRSGPRCRRGWRRCRPASAAACRDRGYGCPCSLRSVP